MPYIALYRNYRPNNFDEVAGQKHVIKTLKNAVINKKISHAYLFSGQRGIGKTTVARILARAVNCLNPHDGEPCNECKNCKAILNNETPDIIEIDAASNNGVDEMRSLLEKVNFLPSTLSKKVYIIDEVHMLSISAFNALLKTLEEPPVHVMFILATTEPHKIPMTILSRCQRFDFKQLTSEEIVSRLDEIIEKEHIKINVPAKYAIAEAAEGGMRDAVNILDQVSSYATEEITPNDVDNVTGRVSNYKLIELLNSFINKDAKSSLKIVDELLDMGKEIGRLTNNLIQLLRDILLYKNNASLTEYKNIYSSEEFKEVANKLKITDIFYYIDVLMEAANKIKFSNSSKIYLEVAIMKIISSYKDENNLLSEVEELKEQVEKSTGSIKTNINNEDSLKLGELELKINKIVEELNRLNIAGFKDETMGKISMLEEIASSSLQLPKELDEKLSNIRTEIAGMNISNSVIQKEQPEKKEESINPDTILRIEKIEENNKNILSTIAEIKESLNLFKDTPKKDDSFDAKFREIDNSMEELMNYLIEIDSKTNKETSNVDLSKYQKEVEELKDNYFTLINRFVNNDNTNLESDNSSNINIDDLKDNIMKEVHNLIDTNKHDISDDVLNDVLEKSNKLEELLTEQNNNFSNNILELQQRMDQEKVYRENIELSITSLKDKIESISSKLDSLTDKVTNFKQEDHEQELKDIYKYVDDVKEYNLRLKIEVNDLAKKVNDQFKVAEPIKKLEATEIKEPQEVKEEVIKQEKVEPKVIENTDIINKEEKINNIKEVNETSKIFDARIVEQILHESRKDEMREEKTELIASWSRLANNASMTTAPVAKLLKDGKLIANGENRLLIVYNMASYCNRLMSPKVHKEAMDILKITFGKEYDFIALPENTWQEKRKEYYSQYGIGIRYPKLTPINNPELKVVVFKDEEETKDNTFDRVSAIFGFNNVRRED